MSYLNGPIVFKLWVLIFAQEDLLFFGIKRKMEKF